MYNIWRLGNSFLQSGRSSLICCDVRYCCNQVLNAFEDNGRAAKTDDAGNKQDKQIKFKTYSEDVSSFYETLDKQPAESSLFAITLNSLNVFNAKTLKNLCPICREDNASLSLDASNFNTKDLCNDDTQNCEIRIIQPDVPGNDHILYGSKYSSRASKTSSSSKAGHRNYMNPRKKSKDEDKSYIINIFLNNERASESNSVNVCLKDLEIQADDICMQKLMKNIQKNYPTINQICQNSENFEECKIRLTEKLEKVWRNVFKSSKIESKLSNRVNMKNIKAKIETKVENKTIEHGQNRVNIIVNYKGELPEKALEKDKVKSDMKQAEIANLARASLISQTTDKDQRRVSLKNTSIQNEDSEKSVIEQADIVNFSGPIPEAQKKNSLEINKNEKAVPLVNTANQDEVKYETEEANVINLPGGSPKIQRKNSRKNNKNQNATPLVNTASQDEKDEVKYKMDEANVINLAVRCQKIQSKNSQEKNKTENATPLVNTTSPSQKDGVKYETETANAINLDGGNIQRKNPQEKHKNRENTQENEEDEEQKEPDQIRVENLTQNPKIHKIPKEKNKKDKDFAPLVNMASTQTDLVPDKITNEYIKRKLEMVEEQIAALAEEHEVIKEKIKYDDVNTVDDDFHIKYEPEHLSQMLSLRNNEDKIAIGTTESSQKENAIQITTSKNKSTGGDAKSKNDNMKNNSETKSISIVQINATKHENIPAATLNQTKEVVIKNTLNSAIKTHVEHDIDEVETVNKLMKHEMEQSSVSLPVSASELVNPNILNVTGAVQLQEEDKSNNPTLEPMNKVANEGANPNPSLLPKDSLVTQEKMVLKSVLNELNKESLEKFIIQEQINRNTNRKNAKRTKSDKSTPKVEYYGKDSSNNNKKILQNNQKTNTNRKIHVKRPENVSNSLVKRTNNRLQRYNEKQQEQIDTLIKLASTPAPQSTIQKMMHFCKGLFKDDVYVAKPTKINQQEDYIDRSMRPKKLSFSNVDTFNNMQYRPLSENISELPHPTKSDMNVKDAKVQKLNIGAINRTEEIIQHQKVFQQKSGIRERIFPHPGGNTSNGGRKMSYSTNCDGIRCDQGVYQKRYCLKDKILNIFYGQKRRYTTKDDEHCENTKSAGDEWEDDPCELKRRKVDPCDAIEEKYKTEELKCCQKQPCEARSADEDDDCEQEQNKCETLEEIQKIQRGVLGCTSKCLAVRDSDEAPDPEPIELPCPKKDDCDPRQDTMVEPEIPKCDVMDSIGHFIRKDATDDTENYYGDNGYKNMEYFKNTPYTFYDVNQHLASKRNPQPNPSRKQPPQKEMKKKRKRKIKKNPCVC